MGVLWFFLGVLEHLLAPSYRRPCIYRPLQGSNWGGMRGDGIPLVKKKNKKHPLCKTTIPPNHPPWIINFVYYVKMIMHITC